MMVSMRRTRRYCARLGQSHPLVVRHPYFHSHDQDRVHHLLHPARRRVRALRPVLCRAGGDDPAGGQRVRVLVRHDG